MPTLRDMVDGKVLFGAGAMGMPGKPIGKDTKVPTQSKSSTSDVSDESASPMADHVSKHIQDPVGSTKDQFNKLQQSKADYDMTREETQRLLSPVQSVINHVSSIHNLQPNSGVSPLGGDPNNPMASDDPNAGQVDENGNPLPPSKAQAGGGAGTVPVNMGQTVGKMNQSRPSLVGNQPGVSPGPQQSVVPPKNGMPQPGNAQGNQYNKTAAPPKGNHSMPGAKGPGDPKVANKANKAQSNSGRAIKVHVSAGALITASSLPVIEASSTIKTHFGMERLRTTSRLSAAADLGANDLRNMLQEALKAGSVNGDTPVSSCGGSTYKWITEVYPLQNYFIYESGNKKYKQSYTMKNGNVSLKGDPAPVKIAYVTASSIRAGGPGSGRHKEMMRDLTQGSKMASKLNEVKVANFLQKLHEHVKNGGSLTEHHQDKLDKHYGRVDTKFGKLQDKLDYGSYDRKTDSKANKYGELTEHLENLVDKIQLSRGKMDAAGTSHGLRKQWSTRRKGHLSAKEKSEHYKTMEAGPEALNDKSMEPGHELTYNPKFNAKGKKKVKGCGCAHSINAKGETNMPTLRELIDSPISPLHDRTIRAGGPGSGRHPGFGNKQDIKTTMKSHGFRYRGSSSWSDSALRFSRKGGRGRDGYSQQHEVHVDPS